MVRVIGFLVGLVFAGVLLISLITGVATYISSPPAPLAAQKFHEEPKPLHLASDGPFGKFDRQQLQRGFQVYSEVCSACHSLKLVSFRDLKGLGYNDAEIKKIASDWKTQVPSINPDTGEVKPSFFQKAKDAATDFLKRDRGRGDRGSLGMLSAEEEAAIERKLAARRAGQRRDDHECLAYLHRSAGRV